MSDTKVPSWRSVIQYWAYNMNLIHRGGMEWPGFGYTKDEKEQREARAKGIPILGSGRIFPVEEAIISVPSFKIPAPWKFGSEA